MTFTFRYNANNFTRTVVVNENQQKKNTQMTHTQFYLYKFLNYTMKTHYLY